MFLLYAYFFSFFWDAQLQSGTVSPRALSPREREQAEQARVNLQREEAIRAAEIAQQEARKRARAEESQGNVVCDVMLFAAHHLKGGRRELDISLFCYASAGT